MSAPCKLCRRVSALQRSHIVPEFLYKPLYDDSRRMMQVHGGGWKGWEFAQRGISERLLCAECETFLNDKIEKPFKALWIDEPKLPSRLRIGQVYRVQVPYAAFKLFHWSVLWRASVSGLRAFSPIALGKHEDELRRRLLALDPGPAWKYPIVGFLGVFDERLVHWVSASGTQTMYGLRTSCLAYAGAHWMFGIASHRSPEFEQIALQQNGLIPLCAVDATTSPVVERVMELVRVQPTRKT